MSKALKNRLFLTESNGIFAKTSENEQISTKQALPAALLTA
jgi:hypothetical protein